MRESMSYSSVMKSDSTGFPDDGHVDCISQQTYPGLYWQMASYDGPNALCLRQNNQGGLPDKGTLTFKNVGCYQKLYFLIAAAGSTQAESVVRELNAIVYYSSGDTTHTSFKFLDHSYVTGGNAKYKACHDNFYKPDQYWYNPNTYAVTREMSIDQHQLIDSICLVNVSRNGDKLNPDIAIIIFAVTGKTADIAAPDANVEDGHEPMQAGDITSRSFAASWDAVDGAASYRIDVATDEDFHHMVDGYNNETVITGTDTIIEGLDADHEYYWRVRAVDNTGGQSASSAPRRVRTESNEGPKATNDDDHDLKTNDITPLLNTTTNLTINRTLYKDGYLNTLCLPFSLTAEKIAAGPLAGCELFEFEYAEKIGDAQLDIHMRATEAIEAGVPYLIQWANTGEVLTSLTFEGVTITTDEGLAVGEENAIRFVGNINTTGTIGMENGNRNHLFVGERNMLYWPNTDNGLKGFRARFEVPEEGPLYVPRNAPARLVMGHRTPTANDAAEISVPNATRRMENGVLYIFRDGVRYNAQGQQLK